VAEVSGYQWPHREFPVGTAERQDRLQTVIRRSALKVIHKHGQSRRDEEICGVLVGQVYHDEQGPFLLIKGAIRGEFAANEATGVTFTAETWDYMQQESEREYPKEKMVGWYHTHPDFGIFLSKMDVFIHGNFFDLPWQVAFVYDPVRKEDGLFAWTDGEPVAVPYWIEEDVPSTDGLDGPENSLEPSTADTPLPGILAELSNMKRRQKLHTGMLALLLIVAILWPVILAMLLKPRTFNELWTKFIGKAPDASAPERARRSPEDGAPGRNPGQPREPNGQESASDVSRRSGPKPPSDAEPR